MSQVVSLTRFAGHELRLAWRDWSWLFAGGRRGRNVSIFLVVVALTVGLHALAYYVLRPQLENQFVVSKSTLIVLGGSLILVSTMMLSQALEMVTRAFYSRDDLDLIMSSPTAAGDLFAVRLVMLAVSNALMSGLFLAPFINVAAWLDSWYWLAGYPVVLALGMLSTAIATIIVLSLFAIIGARRTRLTAQITAAVVSASFLIGIQAAAIVSYGTISRWSVLSSDWMKAQLPDASSYLWLPCLALMGDAASLFTVLFFSVLVFGLATHLGSQRFRNHVLSAASLGDTLNSDNTSHHQFRVRRPSLSFMVKEWKLLARDPWLLSQTLMQVFYLIPPGLMLWVTYGENNPIVAIIAPVVVMAISQLAGGLAWLAISGEDAPDLIATAPVHRATRVSSKVMAVIVVVQIIALPFILTMALISLWGGMATALGALLGASCAILIQMIFHIPTQRSMFRRRQVASKASTFCEAFVAILCAAAAGILAAGHVLLVIVPLVFLVIVMSIAWLLRPVG